MVDIESMNHTKKENRAKITTSPKPIDKWLFGSDDGEVTRLEELLDLSPKKMAKVDIEQFNELGSNAEGSSGAATGLNKRFISIRVPLKASSYKGYTVRIEKTKGFSLENYGIADKRIRLSGGRKEYIIEQLKSTISPLKMVNR